MHHRPSQDCMSECEKKPQLAFIALKYITVAKLNPSDDPFGALKDLSS